MMSNGVLRHRADTRMLDMSRRSEDTPEDPLPVGLGVPGLASPRGRSAHAASVLDRRRSMPEMMSSGPTGMQITPATITKVPAVLYFRLRTEATAVHNRAAMMP